MKLAIQIALLVAFATLMSDVGYKQGYREAVKVYGEGP